MRRRGPCDAVLTLADLDAPSIRRERSGRRRRRQPRPSRRKGPRTRHNPNPPSPTAALRLQHETASPSNRQIRPHARKPLRAREPPEVETDPVFEPRLTPSRFLSSRRIGNRRVRSEAPDLCTSCSPSWRCACAVRPCRASSCLGLNRPLVPYRVGGGFIGAHVPVLGAGLDCDGLGCDVIAQPFTDPLCLALAGCAGAVSRTSRCRSC
jgi:hypothetical protein